MSNFKVWGENSSNILNSSEYENSASRKNGFQANTLSSSKDVNSALRLATLFASGFMEALLPASTVNIMSSVDEMKSAIFTYFSSKFNEKLNTDGNAANLKTDFVAKTSKEQLSANDTFADLFGKIKFWLDSLKNMAFEDDVKTSNFNANAIAPFADKSLRPSSTSEPNYSNQSIYTDYVSTYNGALKNDLTFVQNNVFTTNCAGNYYGTVTTEINGITITGWILKGFWLHDEYYVQILIAKNSGRIFSRAIWRDYSSGLRQEGPWLTLCTMSDLDKVYDYPRKSSNSLDALKTAGRWFGMNWIGTVPDGFTSGDGFHAFVTNEYYNGDSFDPYNVDKPTSIIKQTLEFWEDGRIWQRTYNSHTNSWSAYTVIKGGSYEVQLNASLSIPNGLYAFTLTNLRFSINSQTSVGKDVSGIIKIDKTNEAENRSSLFNAFGDATQSLIAQGNGVNILLTLGVNYSGTITLTRLN